MEPNIIILLLARIFSCDNYKKVCRSMGLRCMGDPCKLALPL